MTSSGSLPSRLGVRRHCYAAFVCREEATALSLWPGQQQLDEAPGVFLVRSEQARLQLVRIPLLSQTLVADHSAGDRFIRQRLPSLARRVIGIKARAREETMVAGREGPG
jgi:hypothetical protein